MGFSGPVDVCHQAIHEAMRLYEIERKKECFEKVLFMSRHFLNGMREKKG